MRRHLLCPFALLVGLVMIVRPRPGPPRRVRSLHVRPEGVSAGRASLYVDGAPPGSLIHLLPESGSAISAVKLVVPEDPSTAIPVTLEPGRWRVSLRGEETGQVLTAALPFPPKPTSLDANSVVAFRSANFPERMLLAVDDAVLIEEATRRTPDGRTVQMSGALRVSHAAAYCPKLAGDSTAFVLESCAHPGLVLAHGAGTGSLLRLALPRAANGRCDGGVIWSQSPGLDGGADTISLIAGPSVTARPLVARHANSRLQLGGPVVTGSAGVADRLLAADASWHLVPPPPSSCDSLTELRAAQIAAAKLAQPTMRASLLLTIGGRPARGRLEFNLYGHVAPKTVRNFAQLCQPASEAATASSSGTLFRYAGTPIQRVIPGFMAQGGSTDGGYGKSAAGGRFDDESFALSHDARGVLSMANAGEDTNGSQFFILFAAQPHLDGKHVVFGRLAEGAADGPAVLDELEKAGSHSGATSAVVRIAECTVRRLGDAIDDRGKAWQ